MRGFPIERDTQLGSVKEVANSRFLVDFFWDIGGMEKTEGWVIWDWSLREFSYRVTDRFPEVL